MPETASGEPAVSQASCGRPVERSPDGRYLRYDVQLGRGAFKTVYKAFDEREGIEVAWNQIRSYDLGKEDGSMDQKLDNEIQVLKQLKHKHIMTFYDSWVDNANGTVNFITELFTSGTLRQYRKRHKKISEGVLKRWAWQILQGLVYLHGHDPPIIHRDLKCDNIFVNGSAGQVSIGDLGLATLVRHSTAPQSCLGTPEFMAPELYDERYDEKADIYSFGMCMLELATLEYPYSECGNPAQIYKRVSQGVAPEGLKKVSDEDLRAFIQLCISHTPAARPEARKLLKHSFFQSYRAEKEAAEAARRQVELPPAPERLSPTGSGSGSDEDEQKGRTPAANGSAAGVETYASVVAAGVEGAGDQPSSATVNDVDIAAKGVDPDTGAIKLELKVQQDDGRSLTIEFDYNTEVDCPDAIMSEMQSDLNLSSRDAKNIVDHLSYELDRVLAHALSGATDSDRASRPGMPDPIPEGDVLPASTDRQPVLQPSAETAFLNGTHEQSPLRHVTIVSPRNSESSDGTRSGQAAPANGSPSSDGRALRSNGIAHGPALLSSEALDADKGDDRRPADEEPKPVNRTMSMQDVRRRFQEAYGAEDERMVN